ncbi:MAG TPA: hypothetical protein VF832_10090 [Longimicrobiales bacterium]
MGKPIRGLLLDLSLLLTLWAPLAAQDTTHTAADSLGIRGRQQFVAVRADSARPAGAWDAPRALALVAEARRRRATPRGDSGLMNYQSHADGFVYFFLDRNASPEKTLVKVDQVALDVYWMAPNLTKQKIQGMRDVSRLPNQMYYHLDHLTVVQNEFSDIIQLGDGDEVRTVLHPAAPGAEQSYQYRVADSLTLNLPGSAAPVRVYELAVRPRNVKQPAFIGSMYVDQRSGAIVRMTFTFTPASYVDKRLDYINVSLENGLFEEKYWLPHEQRLEIRRQIPELDFPAGAVIRGVFRIGDYKLNQQLPVSTFYGPRIEAAPEAQRKAYAFKEGIYTDLNDEGLAPPPDMATLRAQAAQLVRQHYLSGLPRLRWHLGPASSALRYNRAEGIYLGGGGVWAPTGGTRVSGMAGLGTSSRVPELSGELRSGFGDGTELRLDAFGNRLADIGLRPAVPGALNTLSSAFLGTDYLDPYFATGASLEVSRPLLPSWSWSLRLGAERDRNASLADPSPLFKPSDTFRPVRPIDRGTMLSAQIGLSRAEDESGSFGWGGQLALEGGKLSDDAALLGGSSAGTPATALFARPTLQLSAILRGANHATTLRLTVEGGAVLGDVPAQRLFLIGGPGTLPGYDVRTLAGDRFALGGAELTRDVWAPWIKGRLTAAAGWTDFHSSSLPLGWDIGYPTTATGGVKTSAGAGVGLFWDIIRLDLARGLSSGGKWQFVLSVTPTLWDFL